MSVRMRLTGLLRKESLQIVRDPSSIAIALVMPVILLLIFGYGVSLDARDVPIAVVMQDAGPEAQSLYGRFEISTYFSPVPLHTMHDANELMRRGEIDAIVNLQSNFAERLRRRDASPIQLIVNGVDANRARQITGYVNAVFQQWLAVLQLASGKRIQLPVTISERMWFNAERRSQNSLVPGLLVLNMTLVGALLTALVMAREWERGTMEALLVTPVRVGEIVLGKLIPYYVLGMGGMALSVVMTVFLFDVPLRGSLLVLVGVSSLFLFAMLGMGLLISVLTHNQFVAGQTAILVTFLPAFFLSGFIFDLSSTPWFIQALSWIIPARYFANFVKTIFLAGTVWEAIWPQALALAIMAGFFLMVATRKTSKRLE